MSSLRYLMLAICCDGKFKIRLELMSGGWRTWNINVAVYTGCFILASYCMCCVEQLVDQTFDDMCALRISMRVVTQGAAPPTTTQRLHHYSLFTDQCSVLVDGRTFCMVWSSATTQRFSHSILIASDLAYMYIVVQYIKVLQYMKNGWVDCLGSSILFIYYSEIVINGHLLSLICEQLL